MKISVIVPTFNAAKYIRQCLRSLAMQDWPGDDCEVIVMDNGSTDGTVEMAKDFPATVLENVRGNVSELRNVGAQSAKGEILAFIDSDCIVPLTWLSDAAETLKTKNVDAVGCWYALPDNPTWVQEAWDLQMSSKRAEGFSKWLPSGDLMIRKSVFEAVGGFEKGLETGEDTNFCDKLLSQGYKLYCLPVLAVKHLGEAATITQFFKKQRWHGIGGVQRFVREFPKFIFDKTIIFAVILLLSIMGILQSLILNRSAVIPYILIGLFIPVVMSIKTVVTTKKWSSFFHLVLLYLVYGLARMMSVINLRLWVREIKGRRQ